MEEEHNESESERDKLKDNNVLLINKRNSLISGEEDENEGKSNSIEKVK